MGSEHASVLVTPFVVESGSRPTSLTEAKVAKAEGMSLGDVLLRHLKP